MSPLKFEGFVECRRQVKVMKYSILLPKAIGGVTCNA